MKKIIMLLMLAFLMAFGLASCGGEEAPPNEEEPKEDEPVNYIALVRPVEEDILLTDIVKAIYEKNGKMINVSTDENDPIKGEIVFGDADRDVTREAKALLDTMIAEEKGDPLNYAAYIVYKAQDGNIAVYWNCSYAKGQALSTFLSDYANVELLSSMLSGNIYSNVFDLDAYLYTEAWKEIDAEAPADVAKALKELAGFFNGQAITDWIANLWEPYHCVCGQCKANGEEIACYGGAFYYANSARDYEGFWPDVESTSQALSLLVSMGVFQNYGNNWAKGIEEIPGMKEKLIAFCRNLQDEASGYFYHPQWGSNIGAARRGRDLGWATGILKNLGSEPLYPTALDRLQGNTGASATLTRPLGTGVAATVSAVLPTASFESSLGSEEAYMAWLVEITNGDDMFKNSSGAHTISSVSSQIIAAGYLEITLNYLDMRVEQLYTEMKAAYDADPVNNPKPTGLWQRTADYNAVWGVLKLSGLYNSGKRAFKYHEEAMETCIKVIMMDADEGGNYHMNDVWNQWASCKRIISNAQTHKPEIVERLYEMANENAVEMIAQTKAKLAKFIQADGTYGYNQGTSAPSTQGTPVSLGFPEGDVNATALAYNTYADVFSVLGYKSVKVCDFRDGERFIETVKNMTSVVKQSATTSEPITFDEEPLGLSTSFASAGYVEYVTDPANANNNVLKMVSTNPGGDYLNFRPHGIAASSNCFVFETDICVVSANREYLFQLFMGDSYMIDIIYKGGKIQLRDNASTSGAKKVNMLNVDAGLGEWFNFRVEYYVDGVEPTIKIYQDGKLKAVSHNYYGSDKTSPTPANTYGTAKIYAMNASETEIYIDNCYFACEVKELTDEDIAVEVDTTTYSYDFDKIDRMPAITVGSGDKVYKTVDPTDPTNNVIAIDSFRTSETAGGSADFLLTEDTVDAVMKGIAFDINIASRGDLDGDGVVGELAGDYLINKNYKVLHQFNVLANGANMVRVSVYPMADADGIVTGYQLGIADGKNGTEMIDRVFSLDTVYSLKLEFSIAAAGVEKVSLYADGELLKESTNLYAGFNYSPNSSFSLSLYSLKRTRGISYFDNVYYYCSEELVKR